MEDMRSKGLDPATADAKAIEGYFQKNPKALEAAKAANTRDIAATAGQTAEQRQQRVDDAASKAAAAAPKAPTGQRKEGTLNL